MYRSRTFGFEKSQNSARRIPRRFICSGGLRCFEMSSKNRNPVICDTFSILRLTFNVSRIRTEISSMTPLTVQICLIIFASM